MYRPYSSSVADSRPFLDIPSLLRNLDQDFVTAFNTGNYDQAGALFVQDGAFMVPHYEPAYGPKPVERLLHQLADAGYEDLRLETSRVEISGDLAMEMGRYTVAIRQPDGTILADRGKYVKAWRRLGAWLMLADCWSSNLPINR
ncbi:MAG TPA: nuclear transport factor 2 family protein [Candidatus Sulfotelmatobacter sp.]|nr:nuclear transport factor 2 family protein [Candidatus Sulfotelmatobacter sp.]